MAPQKRPNSFFATVARYPSQATLPKEAERIVHAAMPEPVAAVAVAVVNSTLAERGQRGAGYGHGGRPLRGSSRRRRRRVRERHWLGVGAPSDLTGRSDDDTFASSRAVIKRE